jgi:hypothetical protein
MTLASVLASEAKQSSGLPTKLATQTQVIPR